MSSGDSAFYGGFGGQLAAAIRAEAFDEDTGQTSWLTKEVLDVASGTGGPALLMVTWPTSLTSMASRR